MVQLISGAVDYGDAAEIYISRVARVSRVSNSVVRLTFCVERDGLHGVEHRVVLHALFDLNELAVEMDRMRRALEVVEGEPPLNGERPVYTERH
jgi:hypothetical protein